ncbi:MAG: hypothetical protein Q7W02_10800 [Candidatus Rokubacteria bacterium]|nr:hypothetical protein [Candidatus Rokubacteria bacterium]
MSEVIESIAAVLRTIPYVLALLLVLIIGLAVTWYVARVLLKYISPPPEIYVHEVYWDGKSEDALAHTFRERFSQWATLPAGKDQAQQVLFLPDHLWRAEQKLADLNVSIAGVKAGDVFGVMQKFLNPPYKLLSVEGETSGQTHYVVLRLQLHGKTKREWRLSQPFEASKGDDAKSVLIDAAVFRVLFDLGEQTPGKASEFPDAQSLEAFVRGAERMRLYQEGQKQSDLVAAIENLRIVEQEMPQFEQGLTLLALALAEDRKEEQAIRIYGRLLRTDAPLDKQLLAGLSPDEKARRYQLELNRSQSHFFRYTLDGAATSLKHLRALRGLIRGDLQAGSAGAHEARKVQSLAAYAAAQLADVTGHLVTFVERKQKVSGATIDALNEARAAASQQAIKTATMPLQEFVAAVASTHRAFLTEAQDADQHAIPYWTSGAHSATAERRALQRLIMSAQGYTRYRQALLEAPNEAQFRTECDQAIRELESANAAQPRQYTVLQNLGAIYAEPSFSSALSDLSTAADYFQQSLKLKPNDYWGHYKLAQIYGRLAAKPAGSGNDLKLAREHVDKALALRDDDEGLLLVSARVAMWEWSALSGDGRDAKRAEIDQLLHNARSDDPGELHWAKAVWAIQKIRGFHSSKTEAKEKEAEFLLERKNSLESLKNAKAFYDSHTTWWAKDRAVRIATAEKEVAASNLATHALVTALF